MRVAPGVRYMLIAAFIFTLMKACVKMVPHIPAIEAILFRSVISLIISVYFLSRQQVSIWGNNKPVLFLRGLTGSIALVTYFMLLQQIPLATASTLLYLAPIFTTVLGIWIVGEKVKGAQWPFFAASFAGILVIQGFDPRISPIHVGMGIGASVFMGLAYNFIRKLKTSEHPLVIIFYFPLIMLPISGVWSALVWIQPKGTDWFFLILIGILTQTAQFFMTKAYQSSSLAQVSIVNYTSIVYALALGWVFFGESFNLMTYVGMGLVLVGVIGSTLWQHRKA